MSASAAIEISKEVSAGYASCLNIIVDTVETARAYMIANEEIFTLILTLDNVVMTGLTELSRSERLAAN